MEENDLSFKGNDPGASRFGNFINYYQFHSPQSRINSLPKHIWDSPNGNSEHCAILDVGCNCGDLTLCLHSFISENSKWRKVSALGIDIDDMLIKRAREKKPQGVTFECMDIMSVSSQSMLEDHLKSLGKQQFDIVFCFSTTMWIHLNYGDDGLKSFLKFLCEKSNLIVIEPQPWKCYRNAVRRMKKCSETFPLYAELKIKNIDDYIKNTILENKQFVCSFESTSADWDRKINIFNKYSDRTI